MSFQTKVSLDVWKLLLLWQHHLVIFSLFMLLGDWIFDAQVLKEKLEEKARQEVEPHVPYYRIRILVKILILNLKGRPCLAWRATEEEIAPVAKVEDDDNDYDFDDDDNDGDDDNNNNWWWRWFLNSDSRAKLLSFARARRGRTNWAKVVSMSLHFIWY